MATQPILISSSAGDVLGEFASEPVSLAGLKLSGIRIEWYEGVAIVQEVSRLLLESSPHRSASELTADGVSIDRAGTVLVPRDVVQDGTAAVSQVGALLRNLLPDVLPVPLRLAISQAMSSPPHYASIKGFSEALSYFERPDRTGIIRALYERWEVNVSGQPAAPSGRDIVRENPPAAQEPPGKEPRRRARIAATAWQQRVIVALGIGLGSALGLIAAIRWAPSSEIEALDVDTETSALPSDRSASGIAIEQAGREIARRTTTAQVFAPLSATTPAPKTETQTTSPLQGARLDLEQRPPTESTAPEQAMTSISDAARSAEAPRPSTRQTAATANHTDVSVTLVEFMPGSHIYSAIDADVAAPVAAYPQSPTVATVLHDDEVLTFDVVIDQVGKVESVKLRRAPSTIRSALMLTMSMSVAKAWRFQPAIRHGQSVKYRQSISVPAPK